MVAEAYLSAAVRAAGACELAPPLHCIRPATQLCVVGGARHVTRLQMQRSVGRISARSSAFVASPYTSRWRSHVRRQCRGVSEAERAERAGGGSRPGRAQEGENDSPCEWSRKLYRTADGRTYTLRGTKRDYCRDAAADVAEKARSKNPEAVMLFSKLERIVQAALPGVTQRDEAREHQSRRPWPRAVYIGLNLQTDLGCRDPAMLALRVQRAIKSGAFGSVYEACREAACRWVVKIQLDRPSAEREIAMARLLKDQHVVAEMGAHELCGLSPPTYVLLYDRWDMDGEALGKLQFEQVFGAKPELGESRDSLLLYTERQLRMFFGLALRLTQLGVTHGDLKLDNFLYRVADDQLRITDLGLAGNWAPALAADGRPGRGPPIKPIWGFTALNRRCGGGTVPRALHDGVNLWQLELILLSYPGVIVALQDECGRTVDFVRFAGMAPDVLRPSLLAAIDSACPQPNDELEEQLAVAARVRRDLGGLLEDYYITPTLADAPTGAGRPARPAHCSAQPAATVSRPDAGEPPEQSEPPLRWSGRPRLSADHRPHRQPAAARRASAH